MAELPGQPEAIVDDDNRTTTHWYLFFRDLWTALAGPWKAFTPILNVSGGALAVASATARYRRVGKTVDVEYSITLTNIGTATGNIAASLPAGPARNTVMLVGRETNVNGKMIVGQVAATSSQVVALYYDGTSPLSNGLGIFMSGSYEVQ